MRLITGRREAPWVPGFRTPSPCGRTVFYSENSSADQDRVRAEGREITATDDAVPDRVIAKMLKLETVKR